MIYISTSPEKLWNALIEPKMSEKYWQHENISDWKPGSKWEHRDCDAKGTIRLVGKVIESSPPQCLVLTWAFPADEGREEKHSRVTFEIEPVKDRDDMEMPLVNEIPSKGQQPLVGYR